jgi:predicted PolB exonuclease-like 3'-5' exonuclease
MERGRGFAETVKKHSVDLLLCRVLCIGISLDGAEPIVLYSDDEKELFTMFDKWFEGSITTPERHMVTFSGFNLKGFDYPIIALRMAKYNMTMKGYFDLSINKNTRFFDLMSIISGFRYGAYYSQDAVCKFMGIPLKDGVDGSMVYTMYKQGMVEEIKDYCKDDVRTVVRIYDMFK